MTVATALIAEDEAPQRAALILLLAELWPELAVVAECEDGLSALESLHAHQPQVVFLDIRMPGLSGLEIARAANGVSHVVFTTAFDEYAVEAFERGAIDYILKPIRRDRLALTMQRVKDRLARHEASHVLDAIDALQQRLATGQSQESIKWVTASAGATTKLFPVDDVLYFRAQDKYTCVATASDQAQIRMSLKELLDRLDSATFWQIHRSVIVRATAIQSVKKTEEGKLVLRLKGSSEELPVSAAFQYRFKPM